VIRFWPFSRAFGFNVDTGELVLAFRIPACAWSPEGVRAYEAARAEAHGHLAELFHAGMRRLVLEDGFAFAAPEGDPRIGWDLGTVASIDVATAQWLRVVSDDAAEHRCSADLPLPDHRPGAADPGR
jgi:hypothetical protein